MAMTKLPQAAIPDTLPGGGGGFTVFDAADAQSINKARLSHLASLDLALRGKSVLDVGCGVGHLAGFFEERGARVVCVDARPENIDRLRFLYPEREAHVANVECDSLATLGRFDLVFCYGLLYHLENPIAALRNIAGCCRELLLLETVVSDCDKPVLQLVDEPSETKNQAVSGFGCRPSPAFVAMALSRISFRYIYTAQSPPEHVDFVFDWKNSGEWQRDGHLLRSIFVGSRKPLDNPELVLLLRGPEI
jgi:SAM-dependent methyltransferase